MKIVFKNLTKKFPNRNKKAGGDVIAVDNFNYEIPDGKLVGLLGPSGCGKSTTLNLISGLEKPTEGQIFFGEDDVTNLPPENRGVGLVFQSYALYPHLTVFKNIQFPLENLRGENKLSKEEMAKRVNEAAKLVQIDELMERKPSELSGGQQQRVAIARALVKTPRVLLLDEPLSNLDARLRLQTREEIRRIQKETGITTIFVTHDQDEAMSISDIIIVMKEGKIHQIGKPQEVYDHPTNLFVAKFLGTPPINVFDGVIKNNQLFIGKDAVLNIKCKESGGKEAGTEAVGFEKAGTETTETAKKDSVRKVFVGIRPEGFTLDADGPLHCELGRLEVMGRDVSIVSTHEASLNENIRSIINADNNVDTNFSQIHFSLKPHKVHIFDAVTEEKIEYEVLSK